MHEYSLVVSLIEILNKISIEKGVDKIKKVNIILGPFGGIEKESIKFYYNFLVKENNLLKDSKLSFKKQKIKIKCLNCLKDFETEKMVKECKYCGSNKLRIMETDEMILKSIEV
jgi:hydrogenase nickel insertion protein HypA